MKKIFYYIAGIALMVATTSCKNSWLQLDPTTQVSSNTALSTISDLQYALIGAYRSMGVHFYLGNYATYYPEVRGEDMQCLKVSSRGYSYYTYSQTSADEDVTNRWYLGYQLIHYLNNIIDAIDNSGSFDLTNPTVQGIRSQCLAMRGFNLFVLTNMFGQSAYSIDPTAAGVVILTSKTAPEFLPTRSTVSECYNQAIKDLTESLSGLSKSKANGFINYWAAEGMLSRVYLYMGSTESYAKALTYSEDIIKNSPYTLWKNSEYAAVWGDNFSTESLFEIFYSDTENVGSEAIGSTYFWDGYNSMVLTQKYLDLLDQDPNDVRHCFTQIGSTKVNTTGKPYYLTKFCGKTGSVTLPVTPQNTNLVIVRLSEIYLIAAECAFRANSSANSLTYLNAIVSRANPSKSVQTSDLNLQRILEEKRRELVGEGVAGVYDLIRTRGASGVIDHTGGYHLAMTNSLIKCNDPLMASPIPSVERTNNLNITQNKGYSN